MSSSETTIRQLVNRLEDASSSERLSALQELQTLAKTEPSIVGATSLQRVLELLREQGSPEEYEESLDLIYRLVKCKDRNAALANTSIILADTKNVELILDLLEHENITVGVMASQILTEIHSNNGELLENQIQDCPAGMIKLLQRLPDTSREEVRNQSLSFIQQLTAKNEEMKKAVVFNEGFDKLVGIIQSEGGVEDSGYVIQDCLSIFRNILLDSDICQRLFFSMGPEWTLRLSEFFSPFFLENQLQEAKLRAREEGIPEDSDMWADEINRVRCSYLALDALAGSLSIVNPKHQKLMAIGVTTVLPSALFWVARGGPSYLVKAALLLLSRAVDSNAEVGAQVLNMTLRLSPSVVGRNVSSAASTTADVFSLNFGWKPLPNDERKCIAVVSLLAERYIYACSSWCGSVSSDKATAVSGGSGGGSAIGNASTAALDQMDVSQAEGFSQSCLAVLDTLLRADSSSTGMLVQYVLAPPPPSPEDDDSEFAGSTALESMRPLCSILLATLVDFFTKISDSLSSGNQQFFTSVNFSLDLEVAERAANVLTLVFLHGGRLARELTTVLNSAHIASPNSKSHVAQPPVQLLPFLLTAAGRTVRIASASNLVAALLRMLAVAVTDCELATRQILEDPSNFFVIDLCTAGSEAAGVSPSVQTMACLFLGSCYESLRPQSAKKPPSSNSAASDSGRLNQQTLLGMVDSKVSLSRFTEILRRPIASPRSGVSAVLSTKDIFFTKSFKSHYENQVESIRNGILEYYSTGDSKEDKDSPQQQVINMLKQKIAELESKFASNTISSSASVSPVKAAPLAASESPVDSSLVVSLQASVADFQTRNSVLEKEAEELSAQVEAAEVANVALIASNKEYEEVIRVLNERLASSGTAVQLESTGADEMATSLKETIMKLQAENEELSLRAEQYSKRIELLEQDLGSATPVDERITSDLTAKNQELTRQVESVTAQLTALLSREEKLQMEKNSQASLFFNFVNDFAKKIGINADVPTVDTINLYATVQAILDDCADSIKKSADYGSDIMATALPSSDLEGEEGSVTRIHDSLTKLEALVTEEKADKERLLVDNEGLKESLGVTEAERDSLSDELYLVKEEFLRVGQNTFSQEQVRTSQEIAELKQLVSSTKAERDAMIANLQAESSAAAAVALETIEELRSQVRRLSDDLSLQEAKSQRVLEVGASNQELQTKYTDISDLLDHKSRELLGVKASLEQVEAGLKEERGVVKSLRSELEDKKKQLEVMSQNIDSELARATQLEESMQQLQASKDTLDIESKNRIESLEKELAEAHRKLQEIEVQLEDKVGETDQLKAVIADLESSIASLTASSGANDEAARALLIKNQECEASLSSLAAELADVRSNLESTTELYTSTELEKDELSSQLSMQSFELSALKSVSEMQTAEIAKLNDQITVLSNQIEAIKSTAAAESAGNNEAIHQELNRLNAKIVELSTELRQKETELQAAVDLSRRREGEATGIRITIESLEADLDSERSEHRDTKLKANNDARAVKELTREVERLKIFEDLHNASESDDSGRPELVDRISMDDIKVLVRDTVQWMRRLVELQENVEGHSSDCRPVESGVASDSLTSVSPKVSELVSQMRQELSSLLLNQIDKHSIRLREKEREVEALSKQLAAATIAQTIVAPSSLQTPSTPTRSNESSAVVSYRPDTTPGSQAISRRSTASPSVAAKEIARLHADVVRERRRLHALQEEHSDLLGLLAQQEIEFGVLRHVMTATLGSTAVADADSKAQKLAIKKYGSYTCYRNEEDLEIGYEVDQLSP